MSKELLASLSQSILPKKLLTAICGMSANIECPWFKNLIIKKFIASYGVDMTEAQDSAIESYKSFNDFFIRKLKPSARVIADSDLISPVDGYVSEIGDISSGKLLQAKGRYYSVQELLAADGEQSSEFTAGKFATLYLSPKDYHRVHMPLSGKLLRTTYIPGALFSVKPSSVLNIPKLFARNERLVAYFATEVGLMALVFVGATIVGSIGTSWGGVVKRGNEIIDMDYQTKNITLDKATEAGFFKLGSTVIMLFAKGNQINFDKNLRPSSAIKFGTSLGDFLSK